MFTIALTLAVRATGLAQEESLLSHDPVSLESDSLSIEPVDSGAADLTLEGTGEVATLTEAVVPATPRSVRFHASGGAVYDDNIFQTADDTDSDTLFLLAAGIKWTPRVTERNMFSLGYTATAFEYLDNSDLGGDINHDARIDGRALWGATTFTGNFGYRHLAGTDISLAGGTATPQPLTSASGDRDLSPQERRDLISIAFGLARPIAGKTSLTAGGRYQADLYDDLPSTDDLSGYLGLGYLVGARTTVGFQGVIGRSGGDDGAIEETYQKALLTASYDPTEKLDFSASAGLDFRQADVDGGGDRTDFVFNLSARYQWREKTGFFLNGGRDTTGSSTVTGAANNRTSMYFGINQKIGEKWSLDLAGGYDFSDYQNPADDYSSVRDEDFTVGRARLIYQPAANWNIGSFYEYRQNDSSDDALSYEGNRFGLQLAVSF
ncbi:MAG: hypothetical protein ACKV19_25790 [Verrucomicrobiales bacterium]